MAATHTKVVMSYEDKADASALADELYAAGFHVSFGPVFEVRVHGLRAPRQHEPLIKEDKDAIKSIINKRAALIYARERV